VAIVTGSAIFCAKDYAAAIAVIRANATAALATCSRVLSERSADRRDGISGVAADLCFSNCGTSSVLISAMFGSKAQSSLGGALYKGLRVAVGASSSGNVSALSRKPAQECSRSSISNPLFWKWSRRNTKMSMLTSQDGRALLDRR
jgi:hypothetical protein